ncbi:MAG: response regulator [Spirochaetales bacterium]|uniref:Response regulator n=1 Tax=Candidatus Thalassospirochaeta sargassi TaxID=3119039 RepID=A0AAJ1MJL3_9SPIO|nr:response regulator [Spirochaetales bacterium]
MSNGLYRFLLVDDEEIITRGISENIDWVSEGFEFLPPCSDGLEAIKSIDVNKPDVVLTDICMPEIDGIEVARHIYENHPETLTLILSGHDEFEYAQQAMSLQVMDFLLKPISSKTLKKHLAKIREVLKKRDERSDDREHLLSLVTKSRRAVTYRYLSRLLGGRLTRPEPELLSDDLGFFNKMECFSVICLEMDSRDILSQTESISPDLLFLTVEEACTEALIGQSDFAKITTPDNRIVVIIGRHHEQSLSREAVSTAARLIDAIKKLSQTTASAGIGEVVTRVEDVFKSYRQAVTALQHRLIAGDNNIFLFSPEESKDLELRMIFSQSRESIRRDIRTGKKEDAVNTCENFLNLLSSQPLKSRQARHEVIKFVSVIIEVVEEVRISDAQIDGVSFSDFLYRLMDVVSLSELERQLLIFFEQVEKVLEEKRESFPRKKLKEITKYIDDHFADSSISIENISEKFFISSGYLTKLFRQNLDQTFVEYVTKKRMERARELLKVSEMKNYQIAEQLGFKDPHYFSSSFKRYFGQTPSEYKNSI